MEIISKADAIALGLKHYFTGKVCQNGHTDKRYVCSGQCFTCTADRTGRWESKNKETIQKLGREWRIENRLKVREYQKQWRRDNPEKMRLKKRKARAARPDQYRKQAKDWRDKNKDRVAVHARRDYASRTNEIKLAARRWATENPTKRKAIARNYEARKEGAEGYHTASDIEYLIDKQKGICLYCPTSLAELYHVDHRKPLSKGGSNWPSNLQLLCQPCNNRKYNLDPIEFERRIGFSA